MNFSTIPRRIMFGFATVLAIAVLLGAFAWWRLSGTARDLEVLTGNVLPSILLLNDCSDVSRDQMVLAGLLQQAESDEGRAEILRRIDANRSRVDDIFKRYEKELISTPEDRRLFEETKRTIATYRTARNKQIELVRQNKVEEYRKWQTETLVPAYEAYIKAFEAAVDYKNKVGMDVGAAGRDTANSSISLIKIALAIAILVAGTVAWLITRSTKLVLRELAVSLEKTESTNRVLRELAGNLDQGATQTASAARQVSAASQTLSSGASEQAASVEETSASLEEISTMIRSTADNAGKAKALAGEAHAVAQAGSRTMIEMNQAMAAIDTSSAEVAKIVKNIDEIAFQTNILALNAAVEAARAGEAGAGFAVVADEVRSLAQRSAAAAKETADKIEAAIASSRNGSRSCAKVGESLTQIADKVSCTDALVGEIATAAREQAQGIEQINTAITQMDQVTQSNSASAEESASAAEALDSQAASLKDMVGQLRQIVGGTAAAPAPLPHPSPVLASQVSVSSGPPAARSRPRVQAPKTLTASPRKAIPMPGDSGPGTGGDDDNFKNF
jgi:methyl-accepting chemotaxis protein